MVPLQLDSLGTAHTTLTALTAISAPSVLATMLQVSHQIRNIAAIIVISIVLGIVPTFSFSSWSVLIEAYRLFMVSNEIPTYSIYISILQVPCGLNGHQQMQHRNSSNSSSINSSSNNPINSSKKSSVKCLAFWTINLLLSLMICLGCLLISQSDCKVEANHHVEDTNFQSFWLKPVLWWRYIHWHNGHVTILSCSRKEIGRLSLDIVLYFSWWRQAVCLPWDVLFLPIESSRLSWET